MQSFEVLDNTMVLLSKDSKLDGFDNSVLCQIPKVGIARLSDKYDLHDMPPELALIRNGVISSSGNIIETQKGKKLSYSVFRLARGGNIGTSKFLEVCKDIDGSPLKGLELNKDYFEVIGTSIWTAKKHYSQRINEVFFH